jgi:hypothetical protein
MAETLTITTPPPQQTTWRVNELHFNWSAASIQIGLIGTNGEAKHHSYSGATATTLMNTLNKADLSNNSLHKRTLNRLITDGVIAGTIAGSPD